ncbi:hypothetical protein FE257_010712 [Aspergillus nanangensis]|uniref:Uncharacterized protein n=1 Tax=Aspergillus nanangensis TaxID=2582783 RepID=A0AAD4CI41_ASPNN|nr:hypothetical protein FE257_010712 [Aspergillus nanangensis]
MARRPAFDQLPLRPDDPPFSAWGLYGPDDQLGSLNLLTAANTLTSAQSEIQTGVRVTMDPPLDVLLVPASNRPQLRHTIIRRGGKLPIHDDEVAFNTQIGAQWDGLRHVTYLSGNKFYNNITSLDNISGGRDETHQLGINNWVQAGGIVGRGILLDFCSYAQTKNIHYELVGNQASYSITAQDLSACAAAQGVEIRYGDILFVRTGFWVGYNRLSEEEKAAWSEKEPFNTWVGVETSASMARFIWDGGVSACAGDAPGWERIPNTDSPSEAGLKGLSLHEIMLGGWGMPIGEMFDLESLDCLSQLPQSINEVSTAWIQSVLSSDIQEAKVCKVIEGTATKLLLDIVYGPEASPPTEVTPERICVKGGFNPSLHAYDTQKAYCREANFFAQLGQGIIIFEDLEAKSYTFGDCTQPLSLSHVFAGVEQLALLHGATWNMSANEFPWLSDASVLRDVMKALLQPTYWDNYFQKDDRIHGIPEPFSNRDRIVNAFQKL